MPLQFALVLFLNIFINTGMGIIIPILPLLLKSFGFSTAALSLPFVILILGRFLSKYYAGQLIARFGNKGILIFCFALYAIVFAIYPHLHSPFMFSTVRFFEGIVEGIGIICLTDMAIVLSGEQRGKLMGYFGSSFGLGFILGPFLGDITLRYFGIKNMFYCGTCIGLLGLALSYFLSKTDYIPKKTKHLSGGFSKFKLYMINYMGPYMPSLLRRALFFSFMLIIPLYVAGILKLNATWIAVYFSGSALLTTFLMPWTGKLADHFQAKKICGISLGIMGVMIIGLGLTHSPLLFSILFAIETLAFAFMLPAGMKVFGDKVAADSERQDIIGYFGSITELATLILAVTIPVLYSWHPSIPWLVLGIVVLLSCIPFLGRT